MSRSSSSSAARKTQWVDEVDDEEVVDAKTVKGKQGKTYQFICKVPKRVIGRRNLPSFGNDNSDDHENLTMVSKDFVPMEHPDDQFNEEEEDPTLKSTMVNFLQKQSERNLARSSGIDEDEPSNNNSNANDDAEDIGGDNKTDRYVPPSLRGKAGGASMSRGKDFADQEQNAIRVSNLTNAVREEDIYDLFEPFGRVVRVSLPRNQETGEPKGFAFVTFAERQSAVEAMNRLQNHGYDHLILNLEWAKPSKDGDKGGLSTSYHSGYGKQLAQDTKERVIFTSHGNASR